MSTMVATQPEIALSPAFPPHTEISPEELLAMPDGGHYELVDGELRERKVSALSNLIAMEISGILHSILSRERSRLALRRRSRLSLFFLETPSGQTARRLVHPKRSVSLEATIGRRIYDDPSRSGGGSRQPNRSGLRAR